MPRIADAKKSFAADIEQEFDEIAGELQALIQRARFAAKDAKGLNDLGVSLNGFASTLEAAEGKLADAKAECRSWLEVSKEPITERTNLALVDAVKIGKAAEA